MALTLEDVDRKLIEAKPELLKYLELDVVLEAKLERAGVITAALADMLRVPTHSPKQRTDLLIDSIRQGPVERFLRFCKVIHHSSRPHLLDYLHVAIDDIQAQLDVEQTRYGPLGPSPSPPAKQFQQQRKHYQDILSRIQIYGYLMRSPFAQIEEFFTKLEIFDNENDRDLHGPVPKRSQLKPISLDDILKMTGDTLRILLEGNPGMGKSSILKHIAVNWGTASGYTAKGKNESKEGAASSDQSDCPASSPLLHTDLLIFVDKSHEGKDLRTTIKNALNGSQVEQERAFCFWQEEPEKCFLFVDGIDEFVNQELLKELFRFMSNGIMNVLVSCRTGHPYLEKQMKTFNRHVKVGGFDTENAQKFVKRFLRSLDPDHTSTTDEKISHLCSFLSSESVQSFYSNPMNCAFVSLLYYNDDVTHEELSQLTLTDLFQKQQECLLKRECIKMTESQEEADELEKATLSSAEGIYRLALHSLLDEEGQTSYNEKDLKAFGIDLKSPAMVLLQKEPHVGGKSYSWPHQIIKEFHAASAVKDETIRYMIASKPELKQLSKFLLSVLIDTDKEAARNLLTAMLTMQSKDPPCASKPPSRSSPSSGLGHPCSQIPVLREFLSAQNIGQLLHSPQVHFPLSEKFLRLKDVQKCLSNTPWVLQNYVVIKGLIDMALEVSSKEEHFELLRNVIQSYLPSSFSGSVNSWFRLCPWDASDDWEGGTVDKLLFLGTKTHNEIHPAKGCFPFLVLQFEDAGGLAYLAGKLGQGYGSRSTSIITVLVHSTDVIDSAESNTVFTMFAKKHHKPDVVQLWTNSKRWLWRGSPSGKAESLKWKRAIITLNKLFQPQKGIDLNPSYHKVLSEEDQNELAKREIRLLDL